MGVRVRVRVRAKIRGRIRGRVKMRVIVRAESSPPSALSRTRTSHCSSTALPMKRMMLGWESCSHSCISVLTRSLPPGERLGGYTSLAHSGPGAALAPTGVRAWTVANAPLPIHSPTTWDLWWMIPGADPARRVSLLQHGRGLNLGGLCDPARCFDCPVDPASLR
eukprot:scaffold4314_cov45-Phaeocystis_antarctica.AAC.1